MVYYRKESAPHTEPRHWAAKLLVGKRDVRTQKALFAIYRNAGVQPHVIIQPNASLDYIYDKCNWPVGTDINTKHIEMLHRMQRTGLITEADEKGALEAFNIMPITHALPPASAISRLIKTSRDDSSERTV